MKAVTISTKGQISIPKKVRDALHIKKGDQLIFRVEDSKIILEPTVNIPRSQAWFWTPEVQEKIKKSEKNFKAGKFKTYTIDELLKELKD